MVASPRRIGACLLAGLPLLLQAFVVPMPPSTCRSSTTPRVITRAMHTLDGQEISGVLQPLQNVILVKVKDVAETSKGGIVLPDQAKEKPTEGEVVEIGPGRLHPETAVLMPMPVKPGDKVLYGKYDGMSMEYDGLPHVLIRDDDVLMTWTGPSLTVAGAQTVRDRILVKVKKALDKSAGGILLAPSMSKQRPTEGEVIKVGPGRIASTGKVADIKMKAGDMVKFKDYAGTDVKIEDEPYLVMYATDVLAKW